MNVARTIARPVDANSRESPRSVLIVDDSPAQRMLLRKSLDRWGYAVIEASSGAEALEICEAMRVELVISDWMMPGMSGLEFCRAFRARHDHPAYFIMLTAQDDRMRLAEGLEGGADDFLSKPFNAVELKARLRAGERVVTVQSALIQRNDELRQINDAIDRDLIEARKLQQSLVPERSRRFGATTVSLLYEPSGRIGGDLVGMFEAGPGRLAAFSVDVAGHGIASALMTARVAGHLGTDTPERNIALRREEDGGLALAAPKDVAMSMNRVLLREWDSDQYFTLGLAGIDLESGEVRLTQAGHPSSAILRASGDVEFVECFGMPIGLIEDAQFAETTVRLASGDRLLLYSDGITECPDLQNRLLEEDGLADIMRQGAGLSGTAFLDALHAALIAFAGHDNFPDDLSAVLVEFQPSA